MKLWYLVQVYSKFVFEDLFQELRIIFLSETNFLILIIVF
jgi:hypothetical protein